MRLDDKETMVGGVVIVLFVLVLSYSYVGRHLQPKAGYTLDATFNRVDGLADGDTVNLGGIKVGVVDGQRLDEHYRAVLTLRVRENLELPTDTSVAIHTDGLFGTKFVVLEPGGETEMLKPGDEITFTQDSVRIDELLELIIAEGKSSHERRRAAAGKE